MTGLVAAVAFVWLGMVLGLSFLEAPLRFRAPGITLPLGLGIGRLVFTALNRVEGGFALTVAVAIAVGDRPTALLWAAVAPVLVLIAQVALVRPALKRRSDRVLAGETRSRSRPHLAYVLLEAAKVITLVVLGVLALGAR
jgi:hypothetical protein